MRRDARRRLTGAATACVVASLLFTTAARANDVLTGQAWQVTQLAGKKPLQGTALTARFTTDGKVSGSGGCNRYSGTYKVSGRRVSVSPTLAVTQMACRADVMAQEALFLDRLTAARRHSVKGGELILRGRLGNTLVVFAVESQELAGSSWRVLSYNNGKQAVVSVIVGTDLTASFDKNGNLSGFAGCNEYHGPYETNGPKIDVGPLASTKKFCSMPPDVMTQESAYLAAVDSTATYRIEGGRLELRTATGAIAAQLERR